MMWIAVQLLACGQDVRTEKRARVLVVANTVVEVVEVHFRWPFIDGVIRKVDSVIPGGDVAEVWPGLRPAELSPIMGRLSHPLIGMSTMSHEDADSRDLRVATTAAFCAHDSLNMVGYPWPTEWGGVIADPGGVLPSVQPNERILARCRLTTQWGEPRDRWVDTAHWICFLRCEGQTISALRLMRAQ